MKTNNEGYGFHGEIASSAMMKREISRLYALAAKTLIDAGIAPSEAEAIDFLDSRAGRHLGDAIFSCTSDEELIATLKHLGPHHMKSYRQHGGSIRANSK